ncbi:MAG: hypothetical protein WDM71_03630 [Ferruginibacter sp.]
MLEQISILAPGSVLAMTFYLPMELLNEEDKFVQQIAEKGARETGSPFVSFFYQMKYWPWHIQRVLRKRKQYQQRAWGNSILWIELTICYPQAEKYFYWQQHRWHICNGSIRRHDIK